MKKKNILPTVAIGIGEITNGTMINCHSYCQNLNSQQRNKCSMYYEKIMNIPGKHTCPYGFNSYVLKEKESHEIFTSLKIKDSYDRKKVKLKISKDDKSLEISDEQLFEMIGLYQYIEKLELEHDEANKFVKDVMHEIRNFNSKVITKSEQIRMKINKKGKKIISKLSDEIVLVENIFALSSLVEARFLAFDCTINPSSLTFGGRREVELHKKFYKAKTCCLDDANNRKLNIKMSECGCRVSLYDSFDLVPFLLLDNAIKYGKEDGLIQISCRKKGKKANISIFNEGSNIDEEDTKHIWERFYKVDKSRTQKVSTGLGLSIVKKIVSLHDEEIWACNKENGVEFIFTLQLAKKSM